MPGLSPQEMKGGLHLSLSSHSLRCQPTGYGQQAHMAAQLTARRLLV